MGKLDEKSFRDACAMKLPPSQSAARASELYTQWQELINNPKWKPLKTVTVDGDRQVTHLKEALQYLTACL